MSTCPIKQTYLIERPNIRRIVLTPCFDRVIKPNERVWFNGTDYIIYVDGVPGERYHKDSIMKVCSEYEPVE